MQALSECPSFLADTHLKYLGWVLNDFESPQVRGLALSSLYSIYRASHRDLSGLVHFTARFEKRFCEMICDVDRNVAIEAIKLVTYLQQLKLLTTFGSTRATVLKLMTSNPHPTIWKALGPLLQMHLNEGTLGADNYINEEGGAPVLSPAANLEYLTAGGVARFARSPLVQLASLLLHDLDADRNRQWATQDPSLQLADLREHEEHMRTRCKQLFRAMGPIEKALTDWTAYVDVLTTDEELEPALEATLPILILLMKEAASTTNESCDAATAGRSVTFDEEDDDMLDYQKRKRNKQRKVVGEKEEECLKLSAALGKALGPMLQRFGAHSAPLRAVLSLMAELRLSLVQVSVRAPPPHALASSRMGRSSRRPHSPRCRDAAARARYGCQALLS